VKQEGKDEEYARRYVERIVSRIGPANQAAVRNYLADKEGPDRNKPRTLQNHAVVLARFDAFLKGKAITAATPEEIRDHLLVIGRRYEAYTEWQHCSLIKAYLRLHYRGALPYEYARVLKRRLPETHPKPIVTEAERDALLAAADRLPVPADRLKTHALLWILWDSGMRVGEIVTLRVDSLKLLPEGLAVLIMPHGVSGQKTGPREVPVRECVRPIQAWLKLHPTQENGSAPLLVNGRRRVTRYWPQNVNALLRRLCKDAGIRRINPHLFRHTWATRKMRGKWDLQVIGRTLGWSATSRMHKIYLHLDQSDIIAELRREAGLAEQPRVVVAPALDDAAIERRVRRALSRLLTEGEAPPSPLEAPA
jgi:integrase